jgi:coenzyme F420-reducing hydrogenase gamma subunit
MKATLLIGQCMYRKNKDHPAIQKALAAKGCPPDPDEIVKALNQAGIAADRTLFDQIDSLPGYFMARYTDNPEYDETFFQITED